MRDPERYREHGRNDPLSDDQRREHPYDFVSLPDGPARGQAVEHDRFRDDRWTGRLTLVYETLAPLHVGSGVFETAAQCGLAGGVKPVRGIVRRVGKPVLPGSGWKGAVRARFEAITRSRLGALSKAYREEDRKLPAELRPDRRGQGKVEVVFRDRTINKLTPPKELPPLPQLSPAEALFGAMGYRGRVHPSDGIIAGPSAGEPLAVPPQESPAAHRLAKPGAASVEQGKVRITEVEGRKFYYDGPLVHSRTSEAERPAEEWIDSVSAGCSITLAVHLESVTLAELGALLVSAGYGEAVGIVRFGGYKAAGLGKVRLVGASGEIRKGWSTGRWKLPPGEPVDPEAAVAAAREALIDPAALAELQAITTRSRP